MVIQPLSTRLIKPNFCTLLIAAFCYVFFFLFKDPVEATGKGETAFVAGGIVKTFTCPVNGNPKPNIEWYSEETGRKIFCGKQYKTGESGCYSCVASNSFGTVVSVTQCLIVGMSVLFVSF